MNKNYNSKISKIALFGSGLLFGMYINSCSVNQKEISNAIDPLYEEMFTLIQEKKATGAARNDFDYGGKMDRIDAAVEKFSDANKLNKYGHRWGPVSTAADEFQFPKGPVPFALNPSKFNDQMDVSAVQKYFMDTYGKNYKKRIEHVHKVMEDYKKN